jgi:hypothetical protein
MVQDVKEVANSVKKSVTTLQQEFQPDVKPGKLQGEIAEKDERVLSESSDKDLDVGLGVRCPSRREVTLECRTSHQGAE